MIEDWISGFEQDCTGQKNSSAYALIRSRQRHVRSIVMPKGTCRLCLAKDVELRDSHFMSAGFYKIAFDETQDIPHPVVISPGASVLSSAQANGLPVLPRLRGPLQQER